MLRIGALFVSQLMLPKFLFLEGVILFYGCSNFVYQYIMVSDQYSIEIAYN